MRVFVCVCSLLQTNFIGATLVSCVMSLKTVAAGAYLVIELSDKKKKKKIKIVDIVFLGTSTSNKKLIIGKPFFFLRR